MELQNWKRAKFFSSSPIFLPGWRVWRRRMCLQSSDRESWHHNRILRLTLYKLTWWIRMRGFQRIITQTKGTKNNGVEVVVDSKKTKLTNTFDDEGKPFWHQMQAVDCVDLPSWSWNGQASYNLKEKREGGVTYTHFFISLEYISSSKKIAVRFGKFSFVLLPPFKFCHNFYSLPITVLGLSCMNFQSAKKVARPEWNFEGKSDSELEVYFRSCQKVLPDEW